MKTTTRTTGAFHWLVQTNPDKNGFDWAVFLHDEVVDVGWNTVYAEALEDAEIVLQEIIDDMYLDAEDTWRA